jgi:putative metallohydrolase (TIGR04338 family)
MKRDFQRSRVYAAERELDGTPTHRKLAECQAFVDKVLRSKWWRSRGGESGIVVEDGRGRSRACYQSGFFSMTGRGIRPPVVKLPRWARSELVILHELAHSLTNGGPWHGREFARNFLALVGRFMGREAATALRESYRKHRVKYRRPQSP